MLQVIAISLAITGQAPADTDQAVAEARKSVEAERVPDKKTVIAAYRLGLTLSSKKVDAPPSKTVPLLAGVYRALDKVKGIARSEKKRMRGVTKIRLEHIRDRLHRDIHAGRDTEKRPASAKTSSQRVPPTETAQSSTAKVSGGGATDVQGAQSLIDLIQATIQPEAWEINGGNATIRYFAPLHVLVVRATGETHHQIGGALGALRRAQ